VGQREKQTKKRFRRDLLTTYVWTYERDQLAVSIPLIVVSASLAVAGPLAFLFRRQKWPRSRRTHLLSIVSISVGVWLVMWSSDQIVSARLIKQWPTVMGTIVQSEIIGDRAIRPLVFYQYRVGDTSYSDSSTLGVPSFGNRRIRLDESQKITAEYRAGDTVTVHYDPSNLRHSTIYAREEWSSYVRLAVGTLLLVAGLFMTGISLFGYSSAGRA